MFKANARQKFFDFRYFKRSVILGIVFAILITVLDLFVLNSFNSALPRKQVFNYFDTIATRIVEEKNTDFLKEPDDSHYSKMLEYYTETRNFKENSITVELYGIHNEKLSLEITDDYTLKNIDRSHDSFMFSFWTLILYFIGYFASGMLISFVFNILIQAIIRTFKKRKEHSEDEDEFTDYEIDENGNPFSPVYADNDSTEDHFYAEDYDEM